jgi:multisubunit Na+/H+ antiporter MnhE subunit
MRYLRAFGAFWYDFLIGDRPELFVGPIVALAAVWLVLQAHIDSGIAGLGLFVAVVLVGAISLYLTLPRRS